MDEIEIIPMNEDDLDDILKIENASFPTPWSKNLFLNALKLKFSQNFVAKLKDQNKKIVVGYICIWQVADEMHILNLAVEKSHRQKGIGTKLLSYCLDNAHKEGIKVVTLEVRISNKDAIRLYEKFGFEKYGVRKRYYADRDEDAMIMVKEWL